MALTEKNLFTKGRFLSVTFFMLCSCIWSKKDTIAIQNATRSTDSISARIELTKDKHCVISITNYSSKKIYFKDLRPLFTNFRFYDKKNNEIDRAWIMNKILYENVQPTHGVLTNEKQVQNALNSFFDDFAIKKLQDDFEKINLDNYKELSMVSFLFLDELGIYDEAINLTSVIDDLKIARIQFKYSPSDLARVKLMDSIGLVLPRKIKGYSLYDGVLECSLHIE